MFSAFGPKSSRTGPEKYTLAPKNIHSIIRMDDDLPQIRGVSCLMHQLNAYRRQTTEGRPTCYSRIPFGRFSLPEQ